MSDQISVPVMRNDDEKLEQRMTSNAYNNILPARYLVKDENGDLVEEPEGLFERVGKNIALGDLPYCGENVTIPESCVREEFEDEEIDVEDGSITVTEDNVRYLSYDSVIDFVNESTKKRLEDLKNEFQEAMEHLRFMPNTPTLINAGDELQQLSACFVDSPDDDINDIHDTAREAALVFQSGGGIGYAFSHLRPYGDTVGSTGGIASGPLSFMRTFDQMCQTIAQGGARRGAQMGIMKVTHPDVIQFIHAKNKDVSLAETLRLNDPKDYRNTSFSEALEEARDVINEEGNLPRYLRNALEGHLANFNISVGVTDEFMQAVKNDEDFTFINPRTGEPHIATEETKEEYAWFDLGHYVEVGEPLEIPAREIWDDMIEGANENGEPGVFYIDNANEKHSFDVEEYPEFEIHSTNPCCAEGTMVNTPSGYERVENVEEGDEISTVIGSETVDEIETHEDYPVFNVEFSDGGSMRVTEHHRFHVIKDGKGVDDVPLCNVEPGDEVRLNPSNFSEEGSDGQYEKQFRRGVIVGDGCYTENQLEQNDRVKISTSEEDGEYNSQVKELFEDAGYTFNADGNYSDDRAMTLNLSNGSEVVEDHNLTPASSPMKTVDVTDFSTRKEAMGFLDGLLASDGNVNLWSTRPQVRYDTASKGLARDVRDICLQLGMHARIYEVTDPQRGGTIDGRKVSANYPKYTVNISGASAKKFSEMSEIGKYHPEKGDSMLSLRTQFMNTADSWKAEIVSIEPCSENTTVYDLYCEKSDTWITHGYVQRGCGEQPLMEYEACNLGHINLSTLVSENRNLWGEWFNDEYGGLDVSDIDEEELELAVKDFLDGSIDWDKLDHRINLGTHFLENVVNMSNFPIQEIEETVSRNRKIGLGIMGLAQMLIQLDMEYGTEVADEASRQIMRYINHRSKRVSHNLAKERGSFPNWNKSKYADPTEYPEWFESLTGEDPENWPDGFPIRNHNTTTIAPTGTTSMIGNTSGGCEPLHNVIYMKNVGQDVQGEDRLVETDNYFENVLEANGISIEVVKKEAKKQMENNEFQGTDSLSTVPDAIGDLFTTSSDLSAKEHASIQCALQEGVDSAISKTVNAPPSFDVEDAKEVFEYTYDNGAKGVTYYRSGTRSKEVIMENDDTWEESEEEEDNTEESDSDESDVDVVENDDTGVVDSNKTGFGIVEPRERPKKTEGETQKISIPHGNMYVVINEDEYGPVEVFATVGKSGGNMESFTEAIARQISLSLRSGVHIDNVIEQLENIRGPQTSWDEGETVSSIPDGIALALKRYRENKSDESMIGVEHQTVVPEENNDEDKVEEYEQSGDICPDCGSALIFQEGCQKCPDNSCGYSKC